MTEHKESCPRIEPGTKECRQMHRSNQVKLVALLLILTKTCLSKLVLEYLMVLIVKFYKRIEPNVPKRKDVDFLSIKN